MPQGLAIATVDVSFPLLAPIGTAAAPSYSWAAAPSTGIYAVLSGGWQTMFLSEAGSTRLSLLGQYTNGALPTIGIHSAGSIAWAATIPEAGVFDLWLSRDAANVLAQRNSTNAQFLRVYNTYTSGAVYERASIGWGEFNTGTIANFFVISTQAAGGASARSIWLNAADSLYLTAGGAGSGQWRLMTTGHFMCVTDNTYDLGQPSFTPRNVYAGTQFIAPAGSSAAPSYTFAGSAASLASGIYGSNIDVNGATIHIKAATGYGKTIDFENAVASLLLQVRDNSLYTTQVVYGPDGALGAPTYSFAAATDTGIYSRGTGYVDFTCQGLHVMSVIYSGAPSLAIGSSSLTFASAVNAAPDSALARLTTASVRLGLSPSATPVAQTFTIGEASRPGTDLNIAGADGTIRSGLGTGNAAGSSLFFLTPTAVGSSTVAQTYGQRLSLSALGATFDIPDQSFRINGQVSGAGASAGTLTNAPAAGNPNFWLPINCGGTVYYFPGW